MAIIKTVRLHPSQSVPPQAGAYLMIAQAGINRMNGVVSLRLACFASVADRATAKAAMETIQAAAATVEAGDGSDLRPPPDPTAEQIQECDALRAATRAAFVAAKVELEQAHATLESVRPIEPADLPLQINVPPAESAQCLDAAGNVDIKKCYQWLGVQPGYEGTEG